MSQTASGAVAPSDAKSVRLLTRRQRRTCALVWAEGHSHRDIAHDQGITRDASYKRSYRARQRLRAAGIEPPDARRGRRRKPAFQLSLNENV
jgi:transposase